jgi:hypothetical protein
MSTVSGNCAEERRVIDVNAVCGDLCTAELKNIRERNAHRRTVMAGIGHNPFTRNGCGPAPRSEQLVPTRCYRREKTFHGRGNRLGADDRRGVTEAKMRVRSEKIQEGCRVPSINGREQTLPPHLIGPKDMIC